MISFWRIFWLECLSLVRMRTLAMLTAAAVAWTYAFPRIARGDGTAEGLRELAIRFSLGGVFTLVVVALLASATGSVARERAAKRLQLTLVRPVRYFVVALGKIAAHVAAGAFVLAVSCAVLAAQFGLRTQCRHVLSPAMPSPREEARAMYAAYMADTNTPVEVRRAKPSVVLRLLENRAMDHYQTIPTNSCAEWAFPGLAAFGSTGGLAVRMRFTNQMEMRQSVEGVFRLGERTGVVSNMTQAVLTVPVSGAGEPGTRLVFENHGSSALMLRPRRDINLLVPADAFGWNLLRSYLVLVSILAFVVSIGVLLSAGLGRPVALFVAFVMLIVGEMSPSVVEQYPDELETKTVDRIGLAITRFAARVTRPVSAMSPLGALSRDECVEPREMWRMAAVELVSLPIVLSLLAGFVIPRKQDDMV